MSSKEQLSNVLKDLGLVDIPLWLFEYDIPSAFKSHERNEISPKYTKEQAIFFRKIRNAVMFKLKFGLRATKNLYSSWFITEDNLERAEKFAGSIREQLISNGFSDKAEKLRIIQIYTTEEGYETFEQRKEEFLLEFILESQKIMDKALKDKKLSDSLLWRANKTVEIVSILKESLADKSKKSRFNEIVDSLTSLSDSVSRFEQNKAQKKQKAKKGIAKIQKAKAQRVKAIVKKAQKQLNPRAKAQAKFGKGSVEDLATRKK